MSERLTLVVEDGINDMLTELAGGERRRGQYLSDIIKGMVMTRGMPGVDAQTLLFAVRGVTGQMQGLEGRVAMIEAQLAARQAVA
jgi:hypothetical protein